MGQGVVLILAGRADVAHRVQVEGSHPMMASVTLMRACPEAGTQGGMDELEKSISRGSGPETL